MCDENIGLLVFLLLVVAILAYFSGCWYMDQTAKNVVNEMHTRHERLLQELGAVQDILAGRTGDTAVQQDGHSTTTSPGTTPTASESAQATYSYTTGHGGGGSAGPTRFGPGSVVRPGLMGGGDGRITRPNSRDVLIVIGEGWYKHKLGKQFPFMGYEAVRNVWFVKDDDGHVQEVRVEHGKLVGAPPVCICDSQPEATCPKHPLGKYL